MFRALVLALTLGFAGCAEPKLEPRVEPPRSTVVPPLASSAESVPNAALAPLDAGVSQPDASPEAVPAADPPPRHPFHEPLPEPALGAAAPARSFANLTAAQCRKELKQRGIRARAPKVAPKTISVPLRITEPLQGVRVVTAPSPSPYGIADCRLVLVLDELAGLLAPLNVASIRIDNLYRPRAKLPGSRKRSQHAYGLAADITAFTLADGRTLSVEEDWHAGIGDEACGADAVMNDPDEESILLRNLVCDIARKGIFHHMLTPGFNAAHRTHFHFDIQRGEKRWAIH